MGSAVDAVPPHEGPPPEPEPLPLGPGPTPGPTGLKPPSPLLPPFALAVPLLFVACEPDEPPLPPKLPALPWSPPPHAASAAPPSPSIAPHTKPIFDKLFMRGWHHASRQASTGERPDPLRGNHRAHLVRQHGTHLDRGGRAPINGAWRRGDVTP